MAEHNEVSTSYTDIQISKLNSISSKLFFSLEKRQVIFSNIFMFCHGSASLAYTHGSSLLDFKRPQNLAKTALGSFQKNITPNFDI